MASHGLLGTLKCSVLAPVFLVLSATRFCQATDTLRDLNGRISLESRLQLTHDKVQIHAVSMIILNLNPFSLQIWHQSDFNNTTSQTSYTLRWKKDFIGFEYIGRHVIDLEHEEMLLLTPDDRLGIYNFVEPGPIDTELTSSPVSVVSSQHFRGSAPSLNHTYQFDDLDFPVRYLIELCAMRGCLSQDDPSLTLTPAISPANPSQNIAEERRQSETHTADSQSYLMSERFHAIVFLWLLLLTFAILLVIILILFLNHKSRNKQHSLETEQQPPDGEGITNESCYLVIDDDQQLWMSESIIKSSP